MMRLPRRLALLPILAAAVLAGLAGAGQAQESAAADPALEPRVTMELTPETTLVGQPIVLRIKVLAPTWLPQPPVFPAMDIPNVIVRLPERASGAISEKIDGETWSGVSRAYRLYPMIEGEISLPAQTVTVTYADPDTVQPVIYEASLDPVRFTATVPEAAAALDPMILASGFALEQEIAAPDGAMGQGDAASRVVTATITGTSPLFIPELIPPLGSEALRAYPKDPVLAENEERGTLSGSRTETVSYVAQYGGSVELPEIALDWFNIETGKVETAVLEATALVVDAPGPPVDPLVTTRQAVALAAALVLVLLVLAAIRIYLLPPLRRLRARRAAIWAASEPQAARQVRRAIGQHDLGATHSALKTWSDRCPGAAAPGLEAALAAIGARTYRGTGGGDGGWAELSAAFQAERDRRLARNRAGSTPLPPLNPG